MRFQDGMVTLAWMVLMVAMECQEFLEVMEWTVVPETQD